MVRRRRTVLPFAWVLAAIVGCESSASVSLTDSSTMDGGATDGGAGRRDASATDGGAGVRDASADSGGTSADGGSATDGGPVVRDASADGGDTTTDAAPDGGPDGTDAHVDAHAAMCGDGVVEGAEPCDDGNPDDGDGCDHDCTFTCSSAAECSDGEPCNGDEVCVSPGTDASACASGVAIADGAPCGSGDVCHARVCVTPMCGDLYVDSPESCDVAIITGSGACPTSCDDGMACTRDMLVNAGGCSATCTSTPITVPANDDGCCPPDANAATDDDCMPICGNGVVESPEVCDDGNRIDTDACSNACTPRATATAFRMSDLDLRDAHMFVNFLGCRDVTDTPLVGLSINGELQTRIQTDGNADGRLDQSLVLVFRPLDHAASTTAMEFHTAADCAAPFASTVCRPSSSAPVTTTSTNQNAALCLTFVPGTVRPYVPAVASTTPPCFVSGRMTMTLDVAGIPVPLTDVRIASTYVGAPASNLVNGLLSGFLSEADANTILIPATMPVIGGMPLSSLFPGGTANCAPHSDADLQGGSTRGWWLYFNFTAPRVVWTGR